MFKLEVEGFQSIKEPLKLEIQGFTVIRGESNIGKSALVRAIVSALSNRPGKEFISIGKDTCRVKIDYRDHTFKWEKKPSGTEYTIDGEAYPKVGRGPGPAAIKLLGIREIQTNDGRVHWPQITPRQIDPPYIVGDPSPVNTAELIGANEDTLILTRANKMIKEDQTRAQVQREALEEQLELAVKKRDKLIRPVQDLQQRLEQLTLDDQKIRDQEQAFKDLKQLLLDYKKWSRLKLALAPLQQMTLGNPPDPTNYQRLVGVAQQYLKLQRQIAIPKPKPLSTNTVEIGLIKRLGQLTELKEKYEQLRSQRTKLGVVGEATISNPDLLGHLNRLEDLKSQRLKYRQKLAEKESLQQELDQRKSTLRETEKKIEELLRDVDGIDNCPLCGNDVDPVHIRQFLGRYKASA